MELGIMSTLEVMQQLNGLMERIYELNAEQVSDEFVDELQMLIQEANAFMDLQGEMTYENHI
jgi:hypothetical protein